MKKLLSLVLIACLCLSLAACGSSREDQAKKLVNDLMDQGDYAGAIEVLEVMAYGSAMQNSGYGQAPADPGAQDTPKETTPDYSRYAGKWVTPGKSESAEISPDGTVIYTRNGQTSEDTIQEYHDEEDGSVRVDLGMFTPDFVQVDGLDVFCAQNGRDFLIREEQYDDLITIVELNEDNWQDYFEIEYIHQKYYDKYGDLGSNNLVSACMLKDEYTDHFYRLNGEDLSLELFYYDGDFAIIGDTKSEELELGELLELGDKQKTIDLHFEDWRDEEDDEYYRNDYHGRLGAIMSYGMTFTYNNNTQMSIDTEYSFSRSAGRFALIDSRITSVLPKR